MTAPITFAEREHGIKTFGTQRWLFELSVPVRFDYRAEVEYRHGAESTRLVVVSWGRLGDTAIFPSDESGRILDMTGFKSWPLWMPAEACVAEWLGTLTSEAVAS